jgi:CRP-like cAMP-binding protein
VLIKERRGAGCGLSPRDCGGRKQRGGSRASDVGATDYLGLTIKMVSRTLKLLEDEAAVEVAKRRRILLGNRSALRRLNA